MGKFSCVHYYANLARAVVGVLQYTADLFTGALVEVPTDAGHRGGEKYWRRTTKMNTKIPGNTQRQCRGYPLPRGWR
ncbi:hypothetical protein DDQ68_20320 [Hymenobacter nivis]|uniref:Uncharacterized protein n=1 Tax=Hymenobacter nivis TaxID=1850093 RepID=A0A2Z3GMD5_9BACT|nr:hypothetical protein DDQ68_20320 [Hymenobacter nivis]